MHSPPKNTSNYTPDTDPAGTAAQQEQGGFRHAMWRFLHRLGSPPHFYRIAGKLIPWLAALCAISFVIGLWGALWASPPDYQQGDSVRIMYIHVPAAWMSLFVYVVMAIAGAFTLIWRMKLAEVVAAASAPIGASFTFIALVTGSLWGKPMWGTYWVWDARLTSELVLLFLYLGVIGLNAAISEPRTAARASAVLAVVGVVNVPIIHYSVVWWNTLHQGPSVTKLGNSSIATSMLIPLLVMFLAFKLYYFLVLLQRARCEVLDRERNSAWVNEIMEGSGEFVA